MSTAARRSHRGDQYQIAVATWWVAGLLSDERIDSVRVDAVALPGEGELIQVDDVVIGYADGTWRFIQAKKNQTDHVTWRLTDDKLKPELIKARDQLEAKASARVEFCSRTPFGDLAKLVEDGADYPDYTAFAALAPATLTRPLRVLVGILERDEAAVFGLLRRIDIGPHHDYDGWDEATRALLATWVTDVETALDVIDRLVQRQQSGLKASGDALRREDLLTALEQRGVLPLPGGSADEDGAAFAAASRIGRQWRRTIGGEPIRRPELQRLIELAGAPDPSSLLLTDGPGTGKTCVLLDFADHVERQTDWCLLFIKGEVFAECANEADLAAAGLPTDLVARAARLARDRRVVVVIDSLDVLSLHREHRSLRLLLALIERLERVANLCVITACRSFDLHYDPLLRERKWGETLTLAPLDYGSVVQPLLVRHGIDDQGFPDDLKALLAVPEHLRLLVDAAAGGASAADFAALTSAYQLQALYLEEVVRRDPLLGDPALTALQGLAALMLRERRLRLPRAVVATDAVRLQRLISQGVLMEPAAPGSAQLVAFGHQTLLDALAVRAALADAQTLAGFIQAHPPFPFLRPAVRGFAMHLRATDPLTYRRQVRAAVDDAGIAFHLKRLLVENLAELVPTDEDWPLIRNLWQTQPDLFRRLLWQVRHLEWFRLLHQHWWPLLGDDASDDPLRADFILRLDRWMNDRPVEVVGLWQQAAESAWGARLNLAQQFPFVIRAFRAWDTPGAEKLLETLAAVPRGAVGPASGRDFLLKPVSRFVDATGRGLELLWGLVTRDLDLSATFPRWDGLHCSVHDFHRKDFLCDQLSRSDQFLDLVVTFLATVSESEAATLNHGSPRYGLLHYTGWRKVHEQHDIEHDDDINTLLDSVADTLRLRCRERSAWWLKRERGLREHLDLGLRYLLLRAYEEDLAGNIEGIVAQLLDREVQRRSYLSFELAELTNRAYPMLPPEEQDAHQTLLLDLCASPDEDPHDLWCIKHIYQALLPIPAPYRNEAGQRFLDRWRPCLGNARAPAGRYSWSGFVRAPVDAQQLLGLSDAGVRRLLRWFTDHDSDRAQHQVEGYVGGSRELAMPLADAAALAPDRFLDLAKGLRSDGENPTFVGAILRGSATQLRHRFGHLNPPPDWQPAEPLPDGPALAGRILAFAEGYGEIWSDEWNAARVIEGCADAVEGQDQAERLVWLLLRLARVKRPESQRVRLNPGEGNETEGRDLMSDAINEPRGIAACATMRLANRVAERGDPWPELLAPLLRRLASDPVASVRAGILRSLPWLHHQVPDLGWDLLARCLTKPHPALWELVGETLYYQLRNQFGRVAPYLDRMLIEAPGPADATWARLTTLALLEGQVAEATLFGRLTTADRPALWKDAAEVFIANMGDAASAPICQCGLLRILDRAETANESLISDLHLTDKLGWQLADLELVARFIECIGPARRQDLLGLPDWLATAARRDPRATLPLLEGLASRLTTADTRHALMDAKPLIAALLELLREADDSDDLDLINRAIALQDRFLALGLTDMDTMLDEALRG